MTSSMLWYRAPAERWVEALPLGNGRLGAMVFGGGARERWQLNEDSLWSGGPEDADNPAAYPALAEIRHLLFLGRHAEAQRLTDETQIRKPSTRGHFGSYTTLGELLVEHDDHLDFDERACEYRRELDLSRALATVRYQLAGTTYFRESFVSQPDQVLAIRLSSSGVRRLGFRLSLARPDAQVEVLGPTTLQLSGQLMEREARTGMRYTARALLLGDGSVIADGSALRVRGASEVVILFAAGTDYRKTDHELILERQL